MDNKTQDDITTAVALAIRSYTRVHGKRIIMPTVLAEFVADYLSAEIDLDREKFTNACIPGKGTPNVH